MRRPAAAQIDHTLLREDASETELDRLCEEACRYGFRAICVYPLHVAHCRRACEARRPAGDVRTRVVAAVGFPDGAMSSDQKVAETLGAIADGADELDVVMAVRALQERDYARALADLSAVVAAAAEHPVKAILETSELDLPRKVAAATLAQLAGAAFVKTSTGFASHGATVEDVRLLSATVHPRVGVKASGGIRAPEFACALLDAGATVLGASASVALIASPDPSTEGTARNHRR